MQTFAKFLILGGGGLVFCGLVLLLVSRFFPGGVPGDIQMARGNTTFYFPVVTCLIISIVGTVVINILMRLLGR